MIKFQRQGKLRFLFAVWIWFACVFAPAAAIADIGEITTDKFNEECMSLGEYTSEADENRWWAKPFDVVSQTAVEFGNEVFDKTAPGMLKVAGVGFGLWLAVFCLKWVGSMTETDPLENLTKVFGMMLKLGMAACLLKKRDTFFTYFVVPILDAGAGMAGLGGGGGSGLGGAIEPLRQIIDNAHKAMAQTQALGDLARCISYVYHVKLLGIELASGLPDPCVWANGCAVTVIVWLLMVFWPVLIFDALFRLGITAAFCPLFIAAWVFPATTRFTQKGFNSVLNIAFFYVCLNFAVKMGMKLLEGASGLDILKPGDETAKTRTVCVLKVGGGEGISHCEPYMGITSNATGLIILTACGFYCFLLLKQAEVFANYFSETSFDNNSAFKAAKATGNKIQNAAGHAVGAGMWAAGKISQGRDRRAARIVEEGRKNGGVFKSGKEEVRYMAAEKRLRDRGYLDRGTGAETKAYGQLLKNGKRRQFMNVASQAVNALSGGRTKVLYKNNDYKTWAGPRKAEEVSNIQTQYQKFVDNNFKD